MITELTLAAPTGVFLVTGVAGAAGILGGALALGIRHGVDWDHIAAITDITSTTAGQPEAERAPHGGRAPSRVTETPHLAMAAVAATTSGSPTLAPASAPVPQAASPRIVDFVKEHREALRLGTLYAVGHGSMVVFLGLLAILFSSILPTWVDGVMERVVGVTLLFLAAYLFYSLYRYWRGEGEFRLKSRWMLIFGGVRRVLRKVRGHAHPHPHPHDHVHGSDRYGAGTSYSIGLLHGIGAETGTQVLIIGTAVGAASKGMAVAALLVFVLGLLVSNTLLIAITTAGFVSARGRQWIFVGAGAVAAVFSLFLGILYLSQSGGILPDLDPLVRWVGGPSA